MFEGDKSKEKDLNCLFIHSFRSYACYRFHEFLIRKFKVKVSGNNNSHIKILK